MLLMGRRPTVGRAHRAFRAFLCRGAAASVRFRVRQYRSGGPDLGAYFLCVDFRAGAGFFVADDFGLDGIETEADWREPVNENIWEMSFRERRRLRIDDLPHDLNEALDELEKDEVINEALGKHVARHFVDAKRQEWRDYITQVSAWELEQYLAKY
jgi:hypothetical protein